MPCLPTRVDKAPTGDRWVHEIKHDGFRLMARKFDGRVQLYSKQGNDWSRQYPLIADALYRLRANSIVLDGEAMCFTDGKEDFEKLWSNCFDETALLCAFDLLELNGEDLRHKPLVERKRRLAKLLARDRPGIHYVEHVAGDGPKLFEHACNLGFEGIVSKRVDLPYRSGFSKCWLKTKNKKHPSIVRIREAFEWGM